MKKWFILSVVALSFASCDISLKQPTRVEETSNTLQSLLAPGRADIYRSVKLTTDMSLLSEEEKQVLKLMIQAADIMNEIFWMETYGRPDSTLNLIEDEAAKKFFTINYGPWDRLDDEKPFLFGIGPKPAGANYYPKDMTVEEFNLWNNPIGNNPYSMVTRGADGQLQALWYHDYFQKQISEATALIRQAAATTSDPELKLYLNERATAMETDQYNASDIAWLSMKNNHLDLIIGPIENYEDKLLGLKTAHEAYVLVKDMEWSGRLAHYATLLPELQTQLPCPANYKKDKVGSDSQLAAFDIVYYAGDCNSSSKTIAVNLPNDEEIQQQFGTRRSQLKNAMRAKYDNILVPLSEMLIAEDQLQHITFDAFFSNVMFHEVAHGLGVKNTVTGNGTVRDALKEQYSALEEEKADVLGLWLITKLFEMGEIKEGQVMDNYVTFLAGIFRSCRFGAASAHGKANMHTFGYLLEKGAFTLDAKSGRYRVNFDIMKSAIDSLASEILVNQGDGDYNRVKEIMATKAVITPQLELDLKRANDSGIPVDVIFEQGVGVLGL